MRDGIVEAVGAGPGVARSMVADAAGSSSSDWMPSLIVRPRAGGVVVDRRARGQGRPAGGVEERGDPLDQVTHHVAGDPALAGRRVVPGLVRAPRSPVR